ncbi:MAG: CHAD domain-containing protein [Gaiellales bacterium]
MRATTERELKLAGDNVRIADLQGEPVADRTFVSTYHDTPDLRLAEAGLTLRHRAEGRSSLWQLKLPQTDARLEVEVGGRPSVVPSRILSLLRAHLRSSELHVVAALRTERSGLRMGENRKGVVEVVRDTVVVLEGGAEGHRFEEIELELLEGPPGALRRVERRLREAGAVDGDSRPTVFRALGLTQPERRLPPPSAPADRLAAVIAVQYRAIMANDPGTRLGADPEHLHRHRVAVRRLRAILRAAGPMLDPAWTRELRDELGLLGRTLGPMRDLDVLIGHLEESAAQLGEPDDVTSEPLLQALAADRKRARRALMRALDSDRYMRLLDRVQAAAARPAVNHPETKLRGLAAREVRKLSRAAARIGPQSTDAELHALRIRVKRARYAAELADPGARRWDRMLARARDLQDVLGAHQDACEAEIRLRNLVAGVTDPPVHIAAGRLIERERVRRATSREQFPEAWARFEQARRRALA